jgi:uncharacterized membrane protein YciS (DUF1049 family)
MSQQINLFNPLFRKKGFSLMSAMGMLYAAAIALVVASLAAVYEQSQLRDMQARAQVVEQAHRAASANQEKLVAELGARKPNAQLEAELAALATRLSERQEVIEALKSGAVGNTDGFSGYLRAFSRQSVSGLWLTGFDIAQAGSALALQGRTLSAEHVADYLKRLNQEQTMQGRQFAAMRISQPRAEPLPAKTPAERSPAPPRYLEFTISTLDIADMPPPTTSSSTIAAPLLGPLSAAAPIEIAPAMAGQAGAR